jgi:hypothetical protein
MGRYLTCWMIACWAVLGGITPATAQTVSFAGFSFAGDYATVAKRFPNAYKIDRALKARDPSKTLSRVVLERTYANPGTGMRYAPRDQLTATRGADQTLMAVLLLTGETVSTERFGAYYKTFVNLRGDALIFDFKNKTVVRSYPLSVVVFDATQTEPDADAIEGFVQDLLLREDGRGLITQFASRMASAALPVPGTRNIQVRRATVSPEALALMPAALNGNPELAGQMLSDAFGSILSAKLGVPILPTGLGHAMGTMSFRLDNGDAYDLKIGEGDYLFDVAINRFAKIKSGENGVGSSFVYGVYGNIRFFEPRLDLDYFKSDLKNGEVKLVPEGQVSVDDFAAYEAAIRGMFLKFSDVLQPKSDPKWILAAAPSKDIVKQVDATREIIKACK